MATPRWYSFIKVNNKIAGGGLPKWRWGFSFWHRLKSHTSWRILKIWILFLPLMIIVPSRRLLNAYRHLQSMEQPCTPAASTWTQLFRKRSPTIQVSCKVPNFLPVFHQNVIWENKCQILLQSSSSGAAGLRTSINWSIPVILVAAEKPVAGEPAWMGERLGELRLWKRLEILGQSTCGQHWVTTQPASPAVWMSVADAITWYLKVRCLIGAEWIVFHWDLQEICKQTVLLFPPQPPLQKETFSCEASFAVAMFCICADMQ